MKTLQSEWIEIIISCSSCLFLIRNESYLLYRGEEIFKEFCTLLGPLTLFFWAPLSFKISMHIARRSCYHDFCFHTFEYFVAFCVPNVLNGEVIIIIIIIIIVFIITVIVVLVLGSIGDGDPIVYYQNHTEITSKMWGENIWLGIPPDPNVQKETLKLHKQCRAIYSSVAFPCFFLDSALRRGTLMYTIHLRTAKLQ